MDSMLEQTNRLVPAPQQDSMPQRAAPAFGQPFHGARQWLTRTYTFIATYEIQQRLALALGILFCLVYTGVMVYHALLRYQTFTATAFDLGNMDQAVWNTLHGRPFAS